MIYDKLENLDKYGFDVSLIQNDLQKNIFNKGRYEINGDKLFGLDLTYNTTDASKGLWEAHRKYIDVQIVLDGKEFINISDISSMSSSQPYENDYELFTGDAQHTITLEKGYFLMLFPHEVHKTSISVNEPVEVRKKVYKILID